MSPPVRVVTICYTSYQTDDRSRVRFSSDAAAIKLFHHQEKYGSTPSESGCHVLQKRVENVGAIIDT
jgi:hypothetical protein